MITNSIIDYFLADFEKISNKNNNIIIDGRYFEEDFVPYEIKFRDKEKEIILSNINLFLNRNTGSNLFLYGTTGTGKTLIARYLNKGISFYSAKNKLKVKVAYINCKQILSDDIDYYIFKRIYEELVNINIKSGFRKNDIYENIYKFIINNDYKLIIILDEVDNIFRKSENTEILYLLLRNYDINFLNRIRLILISNSPSFISQLDQRIKSSFSSIIQVRFSPYNYYELREILKDRAIKALKPGSISEEDINYISARVSKEFSGDARIAINVLRLSATIAYNKNKEKIDREDIDEAFSSVDLNILESIISTLNKTQKLILLALIKEQIKNEDFVTFNNLYEEYVNLSNNFGISILDKTVVYKNLKKIESIFGELIESKIISNGKKGVNKVLKIISDVDNLKKIYEKIKNDI
ncbi:Cdc6-related protein, AAA superfamily ATPase [Candidatus Nanobsidianus stetteri]|uniref:ORC1-type DNA replication protein n=1 Tax=Nanobsidianus stetteri TaxID=1294122 RepID=R1G9D9_NANST|nr:Cdc6-related protein, AAA superfamily ATPase [Candidatus Nanobsidianus stetteri]